ncbi:maleylpyruvate isomerase N-terminal domain-containing protein [Streptomyces sp. NRRL WC-3742]|uniref:maleylpyruvate isomerase N-terminal domain-containing protein n=1 Tax=Streptomyces sp. NRRL WC-3742 TaxID=1463934 RepID=UPI0006892546|nr:maleylpyruvate isomerase N-terminal domain-containing protein [Streptomyces sp. NRRL WC-3742]
MNGRQVEPVRAMLAEAWASWAERGAAFSAEEWERPTRLPGWTVHELYAHVAPVPEMFAGLREALLDGSAEVVDGAGVLRAYNRPGGIAHTAAEQVADAAKESARLAEPALLVARFGAEGPAALEALADVPPGTAVAHPLLGSVTLGALGEVALMEATVHLLDLIAAVGGPPPAEGALHFTRAMLAEVADPVAFIEAAAGRGPSRTVLPVIR